MVELPVYLIANERPLINLDATLVINIGLWILLFLVLRNLLWAPMLKLITAREAGMEGARGEARKIEADAKTKRSEFEAAQKNARAAGLAEREKLRTDAKHKESEIVANARNATQSALESQRAELRTQREALRKEIQATVPQLASDIATKALGREVRV